MLTEFAIKYLIPQAGHFQRYQRKRSQALSIQAFDVPFTSVISSISPILNVMDSMAVGPTTHFCTLYKNRTEHSVRNLTTITDRGRKFASLNYKENHFSHISDVQFIPRDEENMKIHLETIEALPAVVDTTQTSFQLYDELSAPKLNH